MQRRTFLKLGAIASGAFAFGGVSRLARRAAAAQSAVPTVDRLVMTNVVDNIYDVFAKGGKLDASAGPREPRAFTDDLGTDLLEPVVGAGRVEQVRGDRGVLDGRRCCAPGEPPLEHGLQVVADEGAAAQIRQRGQGETRPSRCRMKEPERRHLGLRRAPLPDPVHRQRLPRGHSRQIVRESLR